MSSISMHTGMPNFVKIHQFESVPKILSGKKMLWTDRQTNGQPQISITPDTSYAGGIN